MNWRVSLEAVCLSWGHFIFTLLLGVALGVWLVVLYVPVYWLCTPRGGIAVEKDHLENIPEQSVSEAVEYEPDILDDATMDTSVLEVKKDL